MESISTNHFNRDLELILSGLALIHEIIGGLKWSVISESGIALVVIQWENGRLGWNRFLTTFKPELISVLMKMVGTQLGCWKQNAFVPLWYNTFYSRDRC
jgi:hypothetical protein